MGTKKLIMTDHQFIFILKAKYKKYFENGESVGSEVKKLVADFRQEIEDDLLIEKHKTQSKSIFKKPLNLKKWQH